eukprot:11019298-Lingulodinium_polyedra.AAC.1
MVPLENPGEALQHFSLRSEVGQGWRCLAGVLGAGPLREDQGLWWRGRGSCGRARASGLE